MNKEEIYKRIMVCEKKERDFLEVGNTRTANRYHNEIQKWEKLLKQLNPKTEQELNEYRRGYYKQKEVINKIFSRITLWKMEDITMETSKVLDDLLDILKEVSE